MRERCAWKALRHRTCNLFTATGVLPSRQNCCNCFFRGLRPRLPSLRSVVPSRHKRCIYINLFQDKTQPYICDGFEVQTIHSQPVWLQTITRISAGLKFFSGKIMRNARARGNIFQSFPRSSQFSCKRVQSRTIALSQMSKIEFTRILPWRAIALLRTCSGYAERSRKCQENVCWKRTFVQGESRSQVYLDYAEPQPNVCWKRTKNPLHYFPLFASIT